MRTRTNRDQAVTAAFAVAALFALSACGGSSEAADDNEVASLQAETSGPEGDEPAVVEQSVDDAALEFSQCLRDAGLDVADIGVDADGNIDLRSALGEAGPGNEDFREAMDACRDILDGVGFGGGRAQLADNTEVADALLEFSDCLRDEGFEDIADLTLGRPGAGGEDGPAPGEGGPPAGGLGTREGGFGDQSTRFAERLALDPEDPEVIAAMDMCMPIIDQAFSEAGIGEPPGN
jgi:hypothetical protein